MTVIQPPGISRVLLGENRQQPRKLLYPLSERGNLNRPGREAIDQRAVHRRDLIEVGGGDEVRRCGRKGVYHTADRPDGGSI